MFNTYLKAINPPDNICPTLEFLDIKTGLPDAYDSKINKVFINVDFAIIDDEDEWTHHYEDARSSIIHELCHFIQHKMICEVGTTAKAYDRRKLKQNNDHKHGEDFIEALMYFGNNTKINFSLDHLIKYIF